MGIILGSGTISGQRQYADEATDFDLTLTVADTAEDAVTPPTGKTGRILSLINEGPGKVYLKFDGTATTSDLALDKRDMYAEVDISIATNVSFIGEAGKTPRVRGILWSN
jgi:hypothetical protein